MSDWISGEAAAALDRPEGRAELARQATAAARAAMPGIEVEIFWDGVWIRRIGPHYFPDPDMFRRAQPDWQKWSTLGEKFLRDAADYWFHIYKPEPGHVIVDIGAGRGEDVFAFSQAVGPEGRVFAIEPHPVSFQTLDKFCEWNRLENVTRIQCACVEAESDLQIETLPVWESNYVRAGQPSASSFAVHGIRFDDLCAARGIERIDFLKMNIEGAERQALPGARSALGHTRYVCIAAHDFRAARGEGEQFRTLDFVSGFLRECGFRLSRRTDDPRYYVPYHVHGRR